MNIGKSAVTESHSLGSRRGPTGAWRKGLSNLKTQLIGPLKIWEILLGLVIAALLALPTARFDFRAIPKYKIGDIAVAAIKAPVEMTVPDEAATRKKRDAAANAVPPVFDVDTNTNAALETEVRNLFAQGRLLTRAPELRTRKRLGLTDSLLSRVHSQLQTKLGKQITVELTRILLIHGFSRDLENQMAELMQNVMRPGVTNNRDLLVRFQSQGLVLRDISSNEEKRIRDVYAVRDLHQARDFLRQKEPDLYRLSEPERRVVVSYLDGLITPNVSYNGGETRARQLEAARDVDPVVLQIKKGKTIVREGDEITENELVQLESLRQGRERSKMGARLLGAFALVCFLLLALWRYFVFFQNRNLKTRRQFLLVSLFTLNQYRERAAIIRCGLVLGAVNVLMVLGLNMIKGPLVWDATLIQCLCGFLGGIMAAMFTSLTLPLLETIFGITTDIKLL